MKFEWDDQKAARNLAKHGVSFEEAATAFDDPLYLDFFDPDHPEHEKCQAMVICLTGNLSQFFSIFLG